MYTSYNLTSSDYLIICELKFIVLASHLNPLERMRLRLHHIWRQLSFVIIYFKIVKRVFNVIKTICKITLKILLNSFPRCCLLSYCISFSWIKTKKTNETYNKWSNILKCIHSMLSTLFLLIYLVFHLCRITFCQVSRTNTNCYFDTICYVFEYKHKPFILTYFRKAFTQFRISSHE